VLHGQDGRATNRNGVQSTPYRSWVKDPGVKDPGAYASGLFCQVQGRRIGSVLKTFVVVSGVNCGRWKC